MIRRISQPVGLIYLVPHTNKCKLYEIKVKIKANQSRYRPGVAQRVPGS